MTSASADILSEKYLALAEKLAAENDGVLPSLNHLRVNGYSSLYAYMRKWPEQFTHIRQTSRADLTKQRVQKRIAKYVAIAEKLAAENGNKLHGTSWLQKHRYWGLYECLRRHSEHFAHISREKADYNSKDIKFKQSSVLLAEQLAAEHNGTLPSCRWLIENGYSAVYFCMRRHPSFFVHIRQTQADRILP